MLILENRKVSFSPPPSSSTLPHSLYSNSGQPFVQLMDYNASQSQMPNTWQGFAELPLDLVYMGTYSFQVLKVHFFCERKN